MSAQKVTIENTTSSPDTLLDVLGTGEFRVISSGNMPNLNLIDDVGGNGFARLKFSSASNFTDNYWLFAGKSVNGNDALSKFNLYYNGDSTVGNLWSVLGNGKMGINTSPSDRFHVKALPGEDALRVQIGGQTKLRVLQNGGTTLGTNNESGTPENGLYVQGNTGLGVSNPSDKLAISGDMNITGEVKANSVSGSPGQVLTSNGSGSMEWVSLCDYKKFVDFTTTSAQNWTVPSGVSRIMVEVYGAGGGGAFGGGGGSGGYIKALVDVIPGQTYTITPGNGGVGVTSGSTASGGNGGATVFTGNGLTITANEGEGATGMVPGDGGAGSFNGIAQYIRRKGDPGEPNQFTYTQSSATVFGLQIDFGVGGNTPFTENSAGRGEIHIRGGAGAIISKSDGTNGKQPGGGGGGGNYTNNLGGDGYAVIWW
jgi:hypothetical protein